MAIIIVKSITISIPSLINFLELPSKMKYRDKPVTARIIIAMPMEENVLMAKAMYYGQRSYQRWLDKRINKTEMKFWAVLGSQGCREKKLPTAISMQLFGVVFSTFCEIL